MSQTSRGWPIIRAIGKAATIPGTKIGLSILTDIQDQLSADEFSRQTREALDEIRRDTKSVLALLKSDGITAGDDALREATVQLAEQLYLHGLAERYLYADFKGIEQLERVV